VEPVSTVVCQDHTHEAVRIYLRKPQATEGQVFAALLSARETAARMPVSQVLQSPRRQVRNSSFRRDDARAGIELFDRGWGMGDCQQYAAGPQYCSVMAGYYAGQGQMELAQSFADYAQAAQTLYDVCTSPPPL
jgi:hypothetical protein